MIIGGSLEGMMETLLALSLSNNATSIGLDISEAFLLFAAIVVVIGLYGEHKTPSKHPKHKCLAMLIIIGCSGEVFADGAIFLFSRHLQILSDKELQGVIQTAGGAQISAANAAGAASRARDAASAAIQDAKQAQGDAAQAKLDAKDASLALLVLKKKVGDRSFSSGQEKKLRTRLEKYRVESIDVIGYLNGDEESKQFTRRLNAFLDKCGWHPRLFWIAPSANPNSGVRIEFRRDIDRMHPSHTL